MYPKTSQHHTSIPFEMWNAGFDTGIETERTAAEQKIRFSIGGLADSTIQLSSTGFLFNTGNEDLPMIFRGTTNDNLLYIDPNNDSIGLGSDETTFPFQQYGGSTFTTNPRLLISNGSVGNDTTFVTISETDTPAKAGLIEFFRSRAGRTTPLQFDTVGGFRPAVWDGAKFIGASGLFFTLDANAGTDYAPIAMDIRVGDYTTASTILIKGSAVGFLGLRTNQAIAPITAEGSTVFNFSQVDADWRVAGNGIAFPIFYDAGNAQLNFGGAVSGSIMRLTERYIDINRTNADHDFRIRTTSYSKFFWIDAGLNVAGFGSTFGTEWLRISNNAVTINETGDALTVFRVESDTNANLLITDPANSRVGIGTGTPSDMLQVAGNIVLGAGAAGVDYTLTFDGETNDGVLTWMEDEDYFEFADDTVFDLDVSMIGGTFKQQGISLGTASLYQERYSNSTFAANQFFRKSRGATIGTYTIVQNNDAIGVTRYYGSDGSTFSEGAQITVQVDGTPAAGDVPMDISFQTKPSGGAIATRMIIRSSGNVGVGTVTPLSTLELNGSLGLQITRNTTTTTIDDTAYQWNGNTDGGAFTYTLPAGVTDRQYKIVNTGTSGNTLTVAPNGAEDLLGSNSSFDLYDGESIIIGYNSTDGWY